MTDTSKWRELMEFSGDQVTEIQKKVARINAMTLVNNQRVAHYQQQPLSLNKLQDGVAANAGHIQILEERLELMQELIGDLTHRLTALHHMISPPANVQHD